MIRLLKTIAILSLGVAGVNAQWAEIALSDTYSQVLGKLEGDTNHEYYTVQKGRNKIVFFSNISEDRVMEYYFKNDRLIQQYMILNVPDPNAMVAFWLKNWAEDGHDGQEVTKNGYRAYRSELSKQNGKGYIYVAFSKWFQKECFISLHEADKGPIHR